MSEQYTHTENTWLPTDTAKGSVSCLAHGAQQALASACSAASGQSLALVLPALQPPWASPSSSRGHSVLGHLGALARCSQLVTSFPHILSVSAEMALPPTPFQCLLLFLFFSPFILSIFFRALITVGDYIIIYVFT